MDKPILWIASSLDDLRAFPEDARRMAGFELRRVQQGLQPTDWKPMAGVGAGVEEIRVRTGQEHRVFYIARFEEGVYVVREAVAEDSHPGHRGSARSAARGWRRGGGCDDAEDQA